MRILVMGSGGVGGYFGGRLAAAGNDVTFVARGAHLAAIQKDGLLLDSVLGEARVKPAKAVLHPAEAGKPDVVMFATKMVDAETAAAQLKPAVGPDSIVIAFQNGVEGADVVKRVLPEAHVIPGVARIASHIPRPGVIEHASKFARIEFAEPDGSKNPKLEAFLALCKAAGIDAIMPADIRRAQWIKFAMLAPFSGITALTGHAAKELRAAPGTYALIRSAVQEVIDVAKAEGIAIKPDDFEGVMKTIDQLPDGMVSSMAHDKRAGKPLEVDWLSGGVVRVGSRRGVPTPTHAFFAQALSVDAAGKPRDGA
jgi:2-dehydropantoate 2-reductase